MHLFYISDLQSDIVLLDKEESQHCVKVLRMKAGDTVAIVDGQGNYCRAMISSASPKTCELTIISKVEGFGKRDFKLVMAVAPTKNIDRFEWFLEKATEIGVDVVTPLLCQRSERKDIKPERLQKVIVSAMKQSVKAFLPELTELVAFRNVVEQPFDGDKFIAHCADGEKVLLQNLIQPGRDVIILIGPEGDFSADEIELALKNGYRPVSLGNSRLRTETAAVVACHTANLLNEK